MRIGANNHSGDVYTSGNTENVTVPASPSFQTTLEPGEYTIEYSKSGYHTVYLTNLVVTDVITNANMMMKPDTPEITLYGYTYGDTASLSAYENE